MEFSQADLIEIVCRSSTLSERRGNNFLPNNTPPMHDRIQSRLDRWCQVVARGDVTIFEKRLNWDGLTIDQLQPLLGSVRLVDNAMLPDWTETLNAALREMTGDRGSPSDRCLVPDHPLPFEEIWLAFVQVARQQVHLRSNSSDRLSEVAHADLERCLLHQLSNLGSQALELEFSVFRAKRQSIFEQFQPASQASNVLYQKFVQELLAHRIPAFLKEYSTLARLLAIATQFWIDSTCELLHRLESDWLDLQCTFANGSELGAVIAIQTALSDRHNNGRTVLALTFSVSNSDHRVLKLVYKPKSLALEVAYSQLLTWLNDQDIALPFKVLTVLSRSTYGWVEFVENAPCSDPEAVDRYYQRVGMLLCLLYLLNGTDCHYENLIACSEHPVMIDLETLLHPESQVGREGQGATFEANQKLWQSVLRTHLLPQWQSSLSGRSYDVSGLAWDEQESTIQLPQWQNVNTDGMTLTSAYVRSQSRTNVPSLDGKLLIPTHYEEQIVQGFQTLYQFFLDRQAQILSPTSPFVQFAHQTIRFVFRATKAYGCILEKSIHPKYLQDGIDRSIELDILSMALLYPDAKPPYWAFLQTEHRSLEQLDIPLFEGRSDSDSIAIAPNQMLHAYFTEAPYHSVITRLQTLSHQDLQQQVEIIRVAMYSRDRINPAALNLDQSMTLETIELVDQATAIARELQHRAITAEDGSVTWFALETILKGQGLKLLPMGSDLYGGCCGIALFLSALAAKTGEAEFRDLALSTLQALRQDLQTPQAQQLVHKLGIGAASGCGSLIYTLVQVSQFLGETALLEDAKRLAKLITPELIAVDRRLDIIAGSAGAILGLLSLYHIAPDPKILKQAIACGDHLLNSRVAHESGYRVWNTLDTLPLTGFSHGAAGIAYSLLRLYQITQEPRFWESATEAIAYERSLFCTEVGNWINLRMAQDDKHKAFPFMTSWCHGAPGIGLARLASLPILDTSAVRQEIEIALQTTQDYELHEIDVDHLCCGSLGRIDFLLTAGDRLNRPELLSVARQKSAVLVTRAQKSGRFHLVPNFPKDIYNPGFFQGMAGIGYELLRLAEPKRFPSVLLWEVTQH